MVTLLSPFIPTGHCVLSPLTHLLTLPLPFIFSDITLLITHLNHIVSHLASQPAALRAISQAAIPSPQTLMSCAALTTLHNLTLWGRPSPAVGTSLRAPPPLPPRLSNLTPNSWALLPHTGHLCPWASACFVFSAESTPPLCQVTLQDSTDVLRLTLGSHSPSALPLIALINMFIL